MNIRIALMSIALFIAGAAVTGAIIFYEAGPLETLGGIAILLCCHRFLGVLRKDLERKP